MNELCKCDGAFCSRHQIAKTARERELCSGQAATADRGMKYWDAWEQGRLGATAPEMPAISPPGFRGGLPEPVKAVSSIGTHLHAIIHRETGAEIPCPECAKAISKLDSMTPAEAASAKPELVTDIIARGISKAPKLLDRILLKADKAISRPLNAIIAATGQTAETSQAVRIVGGWVDEAIKEGAEPIVKKPPPAHLRRNGAGVAGKPFIPYGPKVEEHPLPDDVRKNLIYHVYPMKQTQWLWQWNLDQIIQRIDLFNGRRVVAIVHDGNSDHPDAVKEYLHGHDCEFIVEKNSRKGESVTAAKLMEAVKSFEHEVTFRAHAKGVSKVFGKLQKQQAAATLAENGETVHKWTEIMYATCLDDWETVRDQLGRFAMTGPYRRNKRLGKAEWYFSGSFYWYHHVDFYQRRWQDISAARTGVESLPGQLFKASEVGCLHDDNCGSLYHYTYMRDTAWPAFEEWKRQRED